ncbi:MAG TPA: glycerol-3-phosphate dehydrogenase/oxidase [Pirellulales bacterium]|nr:glycerol-3-phosphate dehydrogenase/oxidase [Pirellulales bacterium]
MPDHDTSLDPPHDSLVLILGAGINGAALAREFALSGTSTIVVDTGDLACGATAYSSRLIHGGLRYLEYGEFDLVRESLAERARLLRLAPQFVKPLRLFIPVSNRFGGVIESALRFLKLRRAAATSAPRRGLWLVRAGLRLYDWYARDSTLPRHEVVSPQAPDAPPVDRRKYPWLCSYYDAQIRYPERFVVALFDDARRIAAERGVSFQLLTYHQAGLNGTTASIRPQGAEAAVISVEPAAIVNATGAWVDRTLRQLHVPSKTLMGGTKGSHFVTANTALREALGDVGIYAEAADGRPVFILPFGRSVLVGTTDVPFSADPAEATASEDELAYLLAAANEVLPSAGLTRSDIDMYYSGVRPLPRVDETTTAVITRRHWLEEHTGGAVPVFSVIGGKLTTCRSLAESSVVAVRDRLGLGPPPQTSRERPLPGAEGYSADRTLRERRWRRVAEETGFTVEQVRTVWELCGAEAATILAECAANGRDCVSGTDLPRRFVRWVIDHEWVRRLDDLVERRLMLLYDPRLSRATLRELAAVLVEAERLTESEVEAEVRRAIDRLRFHFGKRVE